MVGNASGCFKNGIILTSLSRNFFTDLRKASVDMPKPQFASSIESANDFFFLHFLLRKRLGRDLSPTVKGHSPIKSDLRCCPVDFFMLSPHNKPAFLVLIPPSFTSLNPFVTFFRPLQPPSSSHNRESMRIPGSTQTLSVIDRKCSHAKQAVHTKSSRF